MDAALRNYIEKLYEEMYDKLIAFAYSNIKNADLAEESAQDTFAIACQKATEVCDSCNPQGWLLLTMHYTLCNNVRSRMRTRKAIEQFLLVNARTSSDPSKQANPTTLYGSFAQSEDFRLLVDMSVHMKSYERMAQERGISIVTCRKRVQRAKERFLKIF